MAATLLIVIAEGAEGTAHGLLPVPVQLIPGGAHEIVEPVTVIVDVSAPTIVGVYRTCTVEVKDVPFAKL